MARRSKYTYRSTRDLLDESSASNQKTNGRAKPKVTLGKLVKLAIFVAALLYVLALNNSAIVDVAGDGSANIRQDYQYDSYINRLLDSDARNHSKLTIQRSQIADKIASRFPEVERADISTPIWSLQPRIKLHVSHPQLILISGGDRFLISSAGVVISQDGDQNINPDVINSLVRVVDQAELNLDVDSSALSTSQMDYLSEIIFQLERKKLKIERIDLLPGGEEIHVHFDSLPYFAKFSFSNDARKSAGAFLAMKRRLESDNQSPESYIDVRVEKRAFVR